MQQTRVRCTCRRNSYQATPSAAPSMMPGMSAMTNCDRLDADNPGWIQRGERIVGDFGVAAETARTKVTCRPWEIPQPDIGQQFQLEPDVALFAG